MKHLSNLIETYLWSIDSFNKRRNALYLLDWISDMFDEGFQCLPVHWRRQRCIGAKNIWLSKKGDDILHILMYNQI
ncbi:MAG: hypothetical protein IKK33_12060 [Lachnospiraceae bacterium]|nr:hypothetical protein [Lachnospiraceae bacterium]